MLLSILSYKFIGDAQAAIEPFVRRVREYEGQSTHVVLDFVTTGIVVDGNEEQAPGDHLVMHSARLDSEEKLKQEVSDIARAKSALGTASTSSPAEVDALRRDKGKGKGEEKGTDQGKEKKDFQDTDASKAEKTKCCYCGELGHRKSKCWKLTADKAKSTSEGKPHNIELGAAGSRPARAAAQQVSSLTVSGRDPEEHVYIWLAEPSAHIQAVFACPPSSCNSVNLHSSNLMLRSASGRRWRRHELRGRSSQRPHRLSTWLEDSSWTFDSTRAGRRLRRGQEEIEVLGRDGIYWIRVDDARNAETALRLCPFPAEVDEEPARQVRAKKLPILPDDSTRSTH